MADKKNLWVAVLLVSAFGLALVCLWDVILGKEVNDITGPKSIAAIVFFLAASVFSLVKLLKKK